MRRVSIYVLFGFSILTAVLAFDYWDTRKQWAEWYRGDFAHRVDRLNDEALVAHSLYDAFHDPSKSAEFLESRRRSGGITFWALFRNGTVSDTSIRPEELPKYRFDFSHPGNAVLSDAVQFGSHFYATEDLGDGYQLVVGVARSPQEFLNRMMVIQRGMMVEYLAGLIVIVIGIFVFFFRDIMAFIRQLRTGEGRSYDEITVHSREADLLMRGFSAYEDRAQQLEQERDLLSWQVLPALRTELMSGREPPYEFNCTLVRTDINNFSKIFNEHPVEPFIETINEFFTEVTHAVSRYNGLIHEFIGDEVIYYFKDDDAGNSVAAALSAIRDVNEIASRFHQMTIKERTYPFTVKSSLAHGSLRFGRFVNGFNLAGPSLIETVRLLSQITEKDGNIVVFDERHADAAHVGVVTEEYGVMKLKGFTEDKRVLVYRDHLPIQAHFDGSDAGFEALRYRRSDDDIVAMLGWAREHRSSADDQQVGRIVSTLRQMQLTKSNGVAQQILLMWIEDLVVELKRYPREDGFHLLASIVRLTESLVPKSDFSAQFEAVLRRATEVDDRRVIANAIDALTLFRTATDPEFSEPLAKHPDNRVAANALVHEGQLEISPLIVKRLQKMLNSKRPSEIASALYAVGEIAARQRQRDSVYFKTQVEFHRLVKRLPDFAFHDDESVRNQAQIAARKAGDVLVLEEIARRQKTA